MRTARGFLFLLLGLMCAASQAATVSVQNLRMWRAPDHTRLVVDLSGPLEHRLFVLKQPDRIVIDMDNGRLLGPLPDLDLDGSMLSSVRTGRRSDGTLRVVLDLKREVRPRTFVLKPYGQYGHRLVIDLFDVSAVEEQRPIEKTSRSDTAPQRGLIIAIDAGHGGEDPGAVGRRYRTREKEVVLAIARELADLVRATPGMQPLLIRDGDYYLGLRERYRKAYRNQADLFISIHADALRTGRARGASVYALSERGASDRLAQILADKENASDLVGGVSISDKDDLLAKVLLDLSKAATISSSLELGADVLAAMREVGPVHRDKVGQAGFAVLKSLDIPSILVETAFISNPAEEKKLRTTSYRRTLARAILKGVERYVARRKPPAPLQQIADAGPRVHVVKRGDTLSAIARKYDIHIDALRFANGLRGSTLKVGHKLRIP